MSIVPNNLGNALLSTSGTSPAISELPALLKRWMALQDEMNAMKADIKQRTTQSKALKDIILRIMETNKVVKLNINKGAVVHKTREVTEKISNGFMLKHCKNFFNGDEERAKALVDYLEENRGSVMKHDLKIHIPKPQGAPEDN